MPARSGRHFLQIPGPTNVPDAVLRAMDLPTIDHRGPEFAALTREILSGLREVFQTAEPIVIFPASGTGAWEAALVNTLSPGDRVLMFETGWFATLWREQMLPPGLSFNAVSRRALAAAAAATLPKSYFAWAPILAANANGFFPYTPATNALYGLRAALRMLRVPLHV